jgi:hypothetical protein
VSDLRWRGQGEMADLLTNQDASDAAEMKMLEKVKVEDAG